MDKEQEDILLINKPRGMSSFDVIRALRKRLSVKKMGHAGTLDPLAEGLMIIGVGKGTKKLAGLVGLDKVYAVDIRFGVRTDTGDEEGEVIEEQVVPELAEEDMRAALESLEGDIELPVPRYSAVKRGGVPLYKRARSGEDFEPPRRIMKVYKLELIGLHHEGDHAMLSLRMRVASGVYVRSVAEEIGVRLGVPASVSRLVREAVGEFTLAQAHAIEDIGGGTMNI